jgi:hypothetical protein
MKKLLLKTMLLLCALIAGSSSTWATTYRLEKVTSVEAGSLYVFEQEGYVMNNTISSNALQTTTSYATTGLSGLETYVWKLKKATGGYYMYNISVDKHLNTESYSTNMSLGSNSTIWTFTFDEDGIVMIKNKNSDYRFLGFMNLISYV